MKDLQRLTEVVASLHGGDPSHIETAQVHEMMDGKTVWKGEVEVFELSGHETATKAFTWSYLDDNDRRQYVAVLNVSPINSPREAVQAAIASQKTR